MAKGTYPLLAKADHWERVPLSDVANVQNGFAFKSSYFDPDRGVPLIRIRDISKEETEHRYWGESDDQYLVKTGEILIGMDGDFAVSRWTGEKALLNQRVCKVSLTSDLFDEGFLYLCLQPFLNAINAETSSVTVKHLSSKTIEEIPLPLPPLMEQHRIVAKIEELFSALDKGIESLKTAQAQLKIYRQSVLKHAFEGKLTAQWREENKDKLETPEQLLARIKQEREARYERQLKEWKAAVKTWDAEGRPGKKPSKPKKLAQSPPLAAEDVLALPKLPEDWSWFSLSAIAGNIQIGPFGSLLHKADYLVGGTPLVNPSHIRSQRIEPDRTLTVSTDKLHQLGKYVMHENDIVIGRRGEMGRCAVVTAEEAGWLCGTGSLFVRLLSSMNPHFYSWVLGSQRVKDFLAASSIGTTMQNLNEDILHRVPVPVCSRHEQDEVFREIERQYSTLDHIEAAIDSEITKSAILRQSVLKKAFAGQLVPQDPYDEPASVLLNRIRAEREKAMQNNHSKKTKKRKTTA